MSINLEQCHHHYITSAFIEVLVHKCRNHFQLKIQGIWVFSACHENSVSSFTDKGQNYKAH